MELGIESYRVNRHPRQTRISSDLSSFCDCRQVLAYSLQKKNNSSTFHTI